MKNESKSWWHVFLSWQIMALCMFFSNIPVSYAQSPDKITVVGCVKDAAGDFLIGATVQVKGISGGTITDIDGNYILKDVPRTATLVFSYVGMQNKEVPVNGKSTINVTLLDDALQLEQVVVIGYGSVKKSDVTGSVTSVKTERNPRQFGGRIVTGTCSRSAGHQFFTGPGSRRYGAYPWW